MAQLAHQLTYNNAEYAEYVARKEMREKDQASDEEQFKRNIKQVQESTGGSKDTWFLVADHISYAGTKTRSHMAITVKQLMRLCKNC